MYFEVKFEAEGLFNPVVLQHVLPMRLGMALLPRSQRSKPEFIVGDRKWAVCPKQGRQDPSAVDPRCDDIRARTLP